MILEHLSGGDLLKHIIEQKSFTEYDAKLIIKQTASTLEHLHSLGIVHRDLKPDNIIFRKPVS